METGASRKSGILVLEDGSIFRGRGFGAQSEVVGEVVFNTSMAGYPELLTDPSYQEQIVAMTYPILGSYGVPSRSIRDHWGVPLHFESDSIKVKGLLVHSLSGPSHWSNRKPLGDWLSDEKVPGVLGLDTRALTQRLRTKGTMLGVVKVSDAPIDERSLITQISSLQDPNRQNLLERVSVKEPVFYQGTRQSTIVVVDCGVKLGIVRSLLTRGTSVVRVPYNYPTERIIGLDPHGIVISNGPGDPSLNVATIDLARNLIETELPILGICLGAQILGLAGGATTYKLKFGHRAINHPCMDLETRKCFITTQNHGYTIDQDSLKDTDFVDSFVNINDRTVEGIRHKRKPIIGIQWHPESSPGPYDTSFLFDRFLEDTRKT